MKLSYTILDEKKQDFSRNAKDGSGLELVSGRLIVIEMDPGDEFKVETGSEVLVDANGKPVLNENGEVIQQPLVKTDFKEIQTYFVADDEKEEEVLSAACWNHYNTLKKLTEEKKKFKPRTVKVLSESKL